MPAADAPEAGQNQRCKLDCLLLENTATLNRINITIIMMVLRYCWLHTLILSTFWDIKLRSCVSPRVHLGPTSHGSRMEWRYSLIIICTYTSGRLVKTVSSLRSKSTRRRRWTPVCMNALQTTCTLSTDAHSRQTSQSRLTSTVHTLDKVTAILAFVFFMYRELFILCCTTNNYMFSKNV